MKIIAVRSIKGGSGATTTAAHLGAALQAEGLPVLLIDLCPTNMLRLHFGMNWSDDNGLLIQLANNKPWYTAAYRSNFAIDFIPHGALNNDQQALILSTLFAANPNWIKEGLEKLDLAQNCWIIIDCPSYNAQIGDAISQLADHSLMLMTADPACYASMQNFPLTASNQHYLVNRFNPLMAVEKDLFDVLQADKENNIAPLNIHRDESIRESLAYKQTVFSCAPHSQAAHDYTTLATWLRAQVSNEALHG